MSALLPAASDDTWVECPQFEQAYQHFRRPDSPSIPEFLARTDQEFVEFAPVLKLSAPAKSLVRPSRRRVAAERPERRRAEELADRPRLSLADQRQFGRQLINRRLERHAKEQLEQGRGAGDGEPQVEVGTMGPEVAQRVGEVLDDGGGTQVIGLPVDLIASAKLVLTDELIRAALARTNGTFRGSGRRSAAVRVSVTPSLEGQAPVSSFPRPAWTFRPTDSFHAHSTTR